MATEFPITLEHPDVKGTTTAATSSSLKVLTKRGWKPQPAKSKTPPKKPAGDGS